ncbi:MAG: hypothetical protein ACI4MS_05040 [Candidatus Coproplasma sp.]
MKISQLYGKKITATNNAKQGVIFAVSCHKKAIDGYICFDENEKEFFANAKNSHITGDVVTFENLGKESKDSFRLRLGLPVYNQDGKFLGNLCDCIIKGGVITGAVCGNKRLPFCDLTFGDAVILKDTRTQSELIAKNMFINAVCGGE